MKLTIIALALLITGCATSSNKIVPAAIQPTKYESLTCEQMMAEYLNVQTLLKTASMKQDDKVNKDVSWLVSGAIFFPPLMLVPAFTNSGTDENAVAIASYKGQSNLLEANMASKCAKK